MGTSSARPRRRMTRAGRSDLISEGVDIALPAVEDRRGYGYGLPRIEAEHGDESKGRRQVVEGS